MIGVQSRPGIVENAIRIPSPPTKWRGGGRRAPDDQTDKRRDGQTQGVPCSALPFVLRLCCHVPVYIFLSTDRRHGCGLCHVLLSILQKNVATGKDTAKSLDSTKKAFDSVL